MLEQVVFLDRDGVINVCAQPHDYIKNIQEFKLLPYVGEAIAKLNKHNILTIIISNQRGIALGLMSMQDVTRIHEAMNQKLCCFNAHIDAIFVCPHEKGTCNCRKPEIGLFLQAEARYDIDKSKSFMIGDSESDIQAGVNYGVSTISVGSKCLSGDLHFSNLLEAVNFIVGGK